MRYSQTDFAAALPSLRPALLRAARRLHCCSWDAAEDLVSQTVLIALTLLSEYRPETGRAGLRRWLHTILEWVVRDERRRAAYSVETTPLEEARSHVASDSRPAVGQVRALLRSLPHHQRILVNEWLEGHGQQEIARRHRLHRNTVGIRLESAFAALRTALPNARELTYSGRLLDFCSRITLYSKPQGVWRSWYRQHPPEVCFTRYRRSVLAARDREKVKEAAKEEEKD